MARMITIEILLPNDALIYPDDMKDLPEQISDMIFNKLGVDAGVRVVGNRGFTSWRYRTADPRLAAPPAPVSNAGLDAGRSVQDGGYSYSGGAGRPYAGHRR